MDSNYLSISFRGKSVKIPTEDIQYIESIHRKVLVHTVTEIYNYYERLDALETILEPCGFIRCHQSFLISSNQELIYCNNRIQIGEASIPVSRQYNSKVQAIFQNNTSNFGTISCVEGVLKGTIFQIRPEQIITLGRNGKLVDLPMNLPMISRVHCKIIYHPSKRQYTITDYSTNGTYLSDHTRLIPKQSYALNAGEQIILGDEQAIIQLG